MAIERFRSTLVGSTGVSVKGSPARIYTFNIVNKHTADVYVKFYDKDPAVAVNPASDSPVRTLLIPASGSVYDNMRWAKDFDNSVVIRCVTGSDDTDTTAPTTKPIIEIDYD